MADSIVGNSPLNSGANGQYEFVPLYILYSKTAVREPTGNALSMHKTHTIISIPLQYPNAKFARVTLSQFVVYNGGPWITTIDSSYVHQEKCDYISPLNSPFIIPRIDDISNPFITAQTTKYSNYIDNKPVFDDNIVYMQIFNNNFIISIRGYSSINYVRLYLNLAGVAEIYY